MKVLIVLTNIRPQPKEAEVFSFKNEYDKYLENCRNKKWRTIEGFQLEFPSICYDDMKNSYYIYPKTKEAEKRILKYYKVIDSYEKEY